MKYMGSKNRIAKEILPIMLKERGKRTWVEPFVGGANMIDKVPNNFQRIGIDYNAHTIEALIAIRDLVDKLPTEVSEKYYKDIKGSEPEPIKSWIRFVCSFGAKLDNGFARNKVGQNYAKAGVSNAQKQSPNLQGVKFINGSYDEYSDFENCLIYCDPPYEGTTKYKDNFNHVVFWQWCRDMASKGHIIFVSEYNAPDDFECVWQKEIVSSLTQDTGSKKAVEKTF